MVDSPERILIIPLRYIGDTILTVPLVRNLRRLFPQAGIDLLASRTTAPLMEICPYLDQTLIEPKSSLARLELIRSRGYDKVFLLRKSATMALLCRLAGVRQVIGYDKQRYPFGYKRWGWFLNEKTHYPSLRTDTPQAVSHLGLLTAAGLPVLDDHLELWTTETDEQRVSTLLNEQGVSPEQPIAVLHATSASHGKQIALEKFAVSVRHLQKAGYQVIATGMQADRGLYEQFMQSQGLDLINLAGLTSLRETFALYKRIKLLLTVDSSPIHLGAAAGVPKIVGVFGPTNERQWGPHNPSIDFKPVFIDLPCRPCYAKVCSHNNCKELITAESILNSIRGEK
ncbi:MAG TPA: glycosyltransferase family 9 protein [Coleofasciculaceae cyanobacterium]